MRGMKECRRGGERSELRKASSCAPSTLILSEWGTQTSYSPPAPAPQSLTVTQVKEPCNALYFTCAAHKHKTRKWTHRKKKSWTGTIIILVLMLHLASPVVLIEENMEADTVDVKTESLKVHTQLDRPKSADLHHK